MQKTHPQKEPAPIFVVTSVGSPSNTFDSRTWGWYPDIEQAKNAVSRNVGGMDDAMYLYVVIEEVQSGIFAQCKSLLWYEWDTKTSNWSVLKEEPKQYNGTINFSMS